MADRPAFNSAEHVVWCERCGRWTLFGQPYESIGLGRFAHANCPRKLRLVRWAGTAPCLRSGHAACPCCSVQRFFGEVMSDRLREHTGRSEPRLVRSKDGLTVHFGNLFCYHDKHGWFGLASNQCSARGPHERGELADPLVLLVRDRKAVPVPPCSKEHR